MRDISAYVLGVLLIAIVLLMIYVGFAFGLTVAVFASGIFALIDLTIFRAKRRKSGIKDPVLIEYCRSFFPVLLIVWVIRSFIIQPYRVPTGSLEPTVMPGDFIAVNQFAYGVKFPIGNVKMIPVGEPKRGDIVLFYPYASHNIIYVKRLIGVPGDHISYKNKVLYINGKKQAQKFVRKDFDYYAAKGQIIPVNMYEENLNGVWHKIFLHPFDKEAGPLTQADGDFSYVVPKGKYFMMGDNRDDSGDSRFFGSVPERAIIGKAFGVWMSWDPLNHKIRWHRIGTSLLPQHRAPKLPSQPVAKSTS